LINPPVNPRLKFKSRIPTADLPKPQFNSARAGLGIGMQRKVELGGGNPETGKGEKGSTVQYSNAATVEALQKVMWRSCCNFSRGK